MFESSEYMDWLFSLLDHKNEDGGLQIMYTIHSEKDMEELELDHLDGHVRHYYFREIVPY